MKHAKKPRNGGGFVILTADLKKSPAWRVLSLTGHRILACLEIEHMRQIGRSNGTLVVTFKDFCAYGIHRHAIAPGLREVEALCLVERTQQGRAGNAACRTPNEFRLTYLPTRSDSADIPATDEWRQLDTIEQAEAAVRAARETGAFSTKSQCRKPSPKKQPPVPETITGTSAGNHHRKGRFPSAGNHHYYLDALHLAAPDAVPPQPPLEPAPEPADGDADGGANGWPLLPAISGRPGLEPDCPVTWSTPSVVEVMPDGREVALADCEQLDPEPTPFALARVIATRPDGSVDWNAYDDELDRRGAR